MISRSRIRSSINQVASIFPFRGYIKPDDIGIGGPYVGIADTVLRHLDSGAKILDYGCGPCDKTAVLQLLGFSCSAADDLSDSWHYMDENRQRILDFASQVGIDFKLVTDNSLPFERNQFGHDHAKRCSRASS